MFRKGKLTQQWVHSVIWCGKVLKNEVGFLYLYYGNYRWCFGRFGPLKLFLAVFKRIVLCIEYGTNLILVGLKTQFVCIFVDEYNIQMIRKMSKKDRTLSHWIIPIRYNMCSCACIWALSCLRCIHVHVYACIAMLLEN